MFLAIVLIILGVFLLLDVLGIFVVTNFWGLFWAIVFLTFGIKMLISRSGCPICIGHMWGGRFHKKTSGQCYDKNECEDRGCER